MIVSFLVLALPENVRLILLKKDQTKLALKSNYLFSVTDTSTIDSDSEENITRFISIIDVKIPTLFLCVSSYFRLLLSTFVPEGKSVEESSSLFPTLIIGKNLISVYVMIALCLRSLKYKRFDYIIILFT